MDDTILSQQLSLDHLAFVDLDVSLLILTDIQSSASNCVDLARLDQCIGVANVTINRLNDMLFPQFTHVFCSKSALEILAL